MWAADTGGILSGMNNDTPTDLGPAPVKADRRALLKCGHTLKTHLIVGRAGLSDAFLQQVRSVFATTDLLKVRLDADNAAESDLLADELTRLVPCHLVQRVGRVALLYRKLPEKT